MAALKKNEIIEAEIEGMTAEGSGVARVNDMVVFVPHAAPGDRLRLVIIKVSKSYAVGKIQEILRPGEGRIVPDCASYPRCGGCTFRHLDYAEECRIKRQRVNDAMKRIGGIAIEAEDFIAAAKPDRYRNKAQLPCGVSDGQAVFGFYAERSHRIIPFTDCRLQPPVFGEIARVTAGFLNDTPNEIYDEQTGKGRFRHLYIRQGFATGEIMVCAVVNANGLVQEDEFVRRIRAVSPDIRSIVINANRERTNVILGKKCRTAWGQDTIRDMLCGVTYEISPLSFYQVNRAQAEQLYERGRDYAGLNGHQVLFDIYCGTGTIGLSMARGAKALYGIEIVPDAVENARRNAAANGINNAEFLCADAAEGTRQLKERGITPDVVVIDPPRKGCSPEVVALIDELSPERVVYISCDPATLARDAARFKERGWQVERLTAVDMFPRTANVETVALLSHKKPDSHIHLTVEFGEGEGKIPLDEISQKVQNSKPKPKVTYHLMQDYIVEKYGFKVHTAYIAEVKRKLGLPMYDAPNAVEELKNPRKHPTPEKEAAIMDALTHFGIINGEKED